MPTLRWLKNKEDKKGVAFEPPSHAMSSLKKQGFLPLADHIWLWLSKQNKKTVKVKLEL
jgi:hypothetical protein